MITKRTFLMVTLLASMPLTSPAQEIDLDFFLSREAGGGTSTVVGAISDEDFNIFVPGTRVIAAEFGGFGGDASIEEPGFNNPGTGADPVTGDTFDFAAAGAAPPEEGDLVVLNRIDVEVGGLSGGDLFFWDGTGEVNFQLETDTTIGIEPPVNEETTNPLQADATGFFDGHPVFTLISDTPGSPAASGVYLISLEASLVNEDPSIGATDPTDPLFILFGSPVLGAFTEEIREEALDAAVGFVNEAIAVPEPHSAALLLLGLASVLRRRQK